MQWEQVTDIDVYDTRYRDVIIETMLCTGGVLPLWPWHAQRVARTLSALDAGTLPATVSQTIRAAVQHLDAGTSWKVRWLTGLYSDRMVWCIQMTAIEPATVPFLLTGTACLPEHSRSGMLKSGNNLRAVWQLRQQEKLTTGSDIVLCNNEGYCQETTIANIFIVRGTSVITPPLQGTMVPGVLRQYLLEKQRWNNYEIIEKNIHFARELLTADSVFLTNAVRGIIPVAKVMEQTFDTAAAVLLKSIIDTELKTSNTIWQ